MKTTDGRATWFAIIAASLLAAPLAAGEPNVRERDRNWTAPPDAVAKVNPLANRPGTAAGGRKVFRQRCISCHGDAGQGTSRSPDLTHVEVQAQSDGELFWKISSGNTREGMPTFSFLPEVQRWQLVLHVRALAGTPASPVGQRAPRHSLHAMN